MSLPYAVGTTLETILVTTPYLTATPADVAHWRERLAALAGLRVGLCWAGERPSYLSKIVLDHRRSITLDGLTPLSDISGAQYILLQKGPPAAEAARPPRGLELHDFTEDARLCRHGGVDREPRSRHQRRYGDRASGRHPLANRFGS
jgi:hypothetical protein